MSKQELLTKMDEKKRLMNEEGMTSEEADKEVGLTTMAPPTDYAGFVKRDEVQNNLSGQKATLDDDGNLQREPTNYGTEWEDDG